ncbi:hypothetical protein A2V56_01360 [Candidatus Woesebacteria bacterium RBG_19FT_COMBO_42_9]|uniref:TrpR like protein, YerC/YecD n=1 Tax=Candidatus Woesebacteria bacterium RBG_16_42_24 TaxID=1802485 RepID=A0A1F7XM26_9BACT|nr:MAG: hypothetical protein A2V97_04750 [Candidatus Woesebacteria bacterium RBG_16_42_24]OGM17917.1 MAG: hypothetical protein A2V56_01360 [Candidatus Woesebacteria bacterium RBG_19FT_COMBO_42_9]OGM66663.1 MAG: hypothetical protein A2985_04560 [Candidatus Woesebacteria bacterium RIFCSPLOWO2_01_FULL_43_11]
MTQVSKYPVSKEIYDTIYEVFVGTVSNLETKRRVARFFSEFLTPTERIMLVKRLAVGVLLAKGYNYRQVSRLLRVSTTTVGRYAFLLNYGDDYKDTVREILRNEKIEEFFLGTAEKIAGILSMAGSKGGSWRYLKEEIRNKRLKRPF